MKKILVIALLTCSLAGFGQNAVEKGVPTLGVPELTDMSNQAVEAKSVKVNQPIQLKLPILNMDFNNSLQKGAFSIKIGLGNSIYLQKNYNLAKSSLSSYFEWKLETAANGEQAIIGKLIKDLPADFSGNETFELQSSKEGLSEITMQWIKPITNVKIAKPQVNKFYITTRN